MEKLEASVSSFERERYCETAINLILSTAGAIEAFTDKERLSTSRTYWFHELLMGLGEFSLAKERYPVSNEQEWIDDEKRNLSYLKDKLLSLLPTQEKKTLYQVIQQRLPQYTSFLFSKN